MCCGWHHDCNDVENTNKIMAKCVDNCMININIEEEIQLSKVLETPNAMRQHDAIFQFLFFYFGIFVMFFTENFPYMNANLPTETGQQHETKWILSHPHPGGLKNASLCRFTFHLSLDLIKIKKLVYCRYRESEV